MRYQEAPEENRNSHLNRLRRPPVRVSGPAMVDALQRASEILGLGFAEVDTEVVPPRRLAKLSRYGVQVKASLLRWHGDARRAATLLATVTYLQTRAVDDALDGQRVLAALRDLPTLWGGGRNKVARSEIDEQLSARPR